MNKGKTAPAQVTKPYKVSSTPKAKDSGVKFGAVPGGTKGNMKLPK